MGCTVVAGAAVSSLDTAEFLARADQGFNRESGLASPCIPHGYNRVAEWQMETCACVIVASSRFLERRGNANAAICTGWRR